MAFADWHHNFRLVPVKVVCEDGPEPFYTLLTVYQRKFSDDDIGQRLFEVRAEDALALGDMLRLWAQGEASRQDKARA